MLAAKKRGLTSVVILNTCNRVEIYSYADNTEILVELLLEQCADANLNLFSQYGYRLNGSGALNHVFRVAAGLESQILGDYEIVGQLKQSLKLAAAHKLLGPLMNRTFSFVLQASKKIKHETALSKGTASVSYAVVEWLNKHMDTAGANILVIGAGSFGKSVLKNIKEYCPHAELRLTNRTPEKAVDICKQLHIQFVSFEMLPAALNSFDVIICCTNAPAPFIHKSFFQPGKVRRIIDLSVPANVQAEVNDIAGLQLVNVDEVSRLVNNTIHMRLAEVPKAHCIIDQHLCAFLKWLDNYPHAKAVAGFKQNLLTLKDKIPFEKVRASVPNFTCSSTWEKGINDRAGHLMNSFKKNQNKGCQVILAYESFIQSHLAMILHD